MGNQPFCLIDSRSRPWNLKLQRRWGNYLPSLNPPAPEITPASFDSRLQEELNLARGQMAYLFNKVQELQKAKLARHLGLDTKPLVRHKQEPAKGVTL